MIAAPITSSAIETQSSASELSSSKVPTTPEALAVPLENPSATAPPTRADVLAKREAEARLERALIEESQRRTQETAKAAQPAGEFGKKALPAQVALSDGLSIDPQSPILVDPTSKDGLPVATVVQPADESTMDIPVQSGQKDLPAMRESDLAKGPLTGAEGNVVPLQKIAVATQDVHTTSSQPVIDESSKKTTLDHIGFSSLENAGTQVMAAAEASGKEPISDSAAQSTVDSSINKPSNKALPTLAKLGDVVHIKPQSENGCISDSRPSTAPVIPPAIDSVKDISLPLAADVPAAHGPGPDLIKESLTKAAEKSEPLQKNGKAEQDAEKKPAQSFIAKPGSDTPPAQVGPTDGSSRGAPFTLASAVLHLPNPFMSPQQTPANTKKLRAPDQSAGLTNENASPQLAAAAVKPAVAEMEEAVWQTTPPVGPPLSGTVVPSRHPPTSVGVRQIYETSSRQEKGGFVLEKTTRIGIEGNLGLLQEAESAMRDIHARPSGTTFFVNTEQGMRKEYYRAKFGLGDLLLAGRKLATDCGYADDVTAGVELYKNGTTYACITFRKREDHAKRTYDELTAKWGIQVQKPLTFASSLGILTWPDSPQKIERRERERTEVFAKFIQECYTNDAPKDPALQRIYRPTHDERRALIGNDPEYIAATDCVLFVYKPVNESSSA